jgi:hypothetical protein
MKSIKARKNQILAITGISAVLAITFAGSAAYAGTSPHIFAAGKPVPSPSATTTATPGYCSTGGSQLWSNLASCGWPDASNTGPILSQCPGGQLASTPGKLTQTITISTPNTVISCQNISGQINIQAPGVTIKNSIISSSSGHTGLAANGTGSIFVSDGASATVDNVTINGNKKEQACIWDQGTSLTVEAVNCSGIDDGIFSWADTSYSQTTGDSFSISDSYFHDFTTVTANGHEDGYQTEGAANGLIQHNTYEMTTKANSAIGIWDSLKTSNAIKVTDNLITGGGFAIYAEDYNPGDGAPGDLSPVGGYDDTKIYFTNNVFSTYAAPCVGYYGVWFTRPAWQPYYGGPTDGWHRSGNIVLETGQNIDNGNPISNGILCQ